MYGEPDQATKPPPPPCAVCGDPAFDAFWGTQLCDGCIAVWLREAPMLQDLEDAHAKAHPEDVEATGVNQWVNQRRWYILKPGVTVRVARDFALSWLKAQRAKARAA